MGRGDGALNGPDGPDGPDPTDDERWMVIGGRRWRRQDPDLPDDVRDELLSHLGRGRSGVRTAKASGGTQELAAARNRVNLAKHGLGERGEPWWDQSPDEKRARWDASLAGLRALDA